MADSIDEHIYIEFIFIWSFDIHVFPWRISNLFIMSQSIGKGFFVYTSI